jgi:hypothetical protein
LVYWVGEYLLYHELGHLKFYAGGNDVHSVSKALCSNAVSCPGPLMISLMGREEAGAVKVVKLTKSPIRLAESIM